MAQAPEMIVICPDCGGDNFYCDNYNGNDIKSMTYFFTEFLPTVENLYAVKKDRASRAIRWPVDGWLWIALLWFAASRNVLVCIMLYSGRHLH